MAKKKPLLGKIRIVFRRSTPLTKILILVPLVICIAVALFLHFHLTNVNAQTDAMRHQAARLEQENQQLQQILNGLDTVEGAQKIAEKELGMVDPDTILLTPTDSTNPE